MSTRASKPPIRRLVADDIPVYLAIASAIASAADVSRRSVKIMDAVNLSTREPWCLLVDTVLAGELRSNYPADSYVGKSFRITKFKPKAGKRYATFAIDEIIMSDPEQAGAIEAAREQLATELKSRHDDSAAFNRSVLTDNPLALPYDEFLRSPQWRKDRKRIRKRDGGFCCRCGGRATLVHHRSYADEVLLGHDDDKLVSLCEGCHTVIHFDESGKKRSDEETDRILMQRDETADFPPPKIDWRRTLHPLLPPEWPRMTAIQRMGWHKEYERLKVIRWGQLGKAPNAVRTILRGYGMDDATIDAAIRPKPPKRKA